MVLQAAGGEPAASDSYHDANSEDEGGEDEYGSEGGSGRTLLQDKCLNLNAYGWQPCPVSSGS